VNGLLVSPSRSVRHRHSKEERVGPWVFGTQAHSRLDVFDGKVWLSGHRKRQPELVEGVREAWIEPRCSFKSFNRSI